MTGEAEKKKRKPQVLRLLASADVVSEESNGDGSRGKAVTVIAIAMIFHIFFTTIMTHRDKGRKGGRKESGRHTDVLVAS
jgi:hypothetical protein